MKFAVVLAMFGVLAAVMAGLLDVLTWAEVVTASLGWSGLILGVRSATSDQDRDEFVGGLPRNRSRYKELLAIEQTRHDRENWAELEQQWAEEESQAAPCSIRFAYRDSAHTWGRVVATHDGPAEARKVRLQVWVQREGGHEPFEPIRGTEYGEADPPAPNEAVHLGVAFAFDKPQAADLRYELDWVDDRGRQNQTGQFPGAI